MKKLLLIFSLVLTGTAQAQLTDFSELWKEHEFRGDQLYNKGLYEAAIEAYEKQLVEDPNNTETITRLAEAHKHLGDYKKAATYFSTLGRSFQLEEKYFEDYADVLLADNKVEEALEVLRQALEKEPANGVLKEKIMGLENWQDFFAYEDFAQIENTPMSTEAAEFGIRRFSNGYAFTSSRIQDRLVRHNYLREITKLTAIYSIKSANEGAAELVELKKMRQSNDGPHAVFGYNYVLSRSFNTAKSNVVLGLYFYQLNDKGELDLLKPFEYNSPEYSITHPAFNSRGDTLFFASDMPGGYGGFDIYYSIYRDDRWSQPVNLAEPINTARNELFPYVDEGVFYFSSKGHGGLGGLDIYKLVKEKELVVVENLGSPINTSWDDFGVLIEKDEGYLSSNRPGGKGLDDIYKFKLLPRPKVIEPVEVSLNLLDKSNEKPVIAAEIKLINEEGTVEAVSDKDGKISKALMPGEYSVVIAQELYNEKSFTLVVDEDKPISEKVILEPAMVVHLVSPDSILFKFGEYNLLHKEANKELDAIVETLKKHPEFNLEISAHTDSRGTKDYNLWLSKKRAETAANYMISKGIDAGRIHQFGYGESQLINNCRDGVRCSDKLHAVNRRLEFDFRRLDSLDD